MLDRLWKIKCCEKMEKECRVDRIKALGNSVCIEQTKEAFKELIGIKVAK